MKETNAKVKERNAEVEERNAKVDERNAEGGNHKKGEGLNREEH